MDDIPVLYLVMHIVLSTIDVFINFFPEINFFLFGYKLHVQIETLSWIMFLLLMKDCCFILPCFVKKTLHPLALRSKLCMRYMRLRYNMLHIITSLVRLCNGSAVKKMDFLCRDILHKFIYYPFRQRLDI